MKSSHVWFRCTLHGNFSRIAATGRQNRFWGVRANNHGTVARLSARPPGHRENGISHGPSPKARCSVKDRQ
ncbi:hypothetical protein ABTL48_21070, partial [Acinetobacter baumannii]